MASVDAVRTTEVDAQMKVLFHFFHGGRQVSNGGRKKTTLHLDPFQRFLIGLKKRVNRWKQVVLEEPCDLYETYREEAAQKRLAPFEGYYQFVHPFMEAIRNSKRRKLHGIQDKHRVSH